MKIGANYISAGLCEFIVWSPDAEDVKLKIVSPLPRLVNMERDSVGYWKAVAKDIPSGTTYLYQIDGSRERPDPASASQPNGVHGFSAVVNHNSFIWGDDSFSGVGLADMVIYELHVGTFTKQGDFKQIIPRLKELVNLGITTLELMPIAQFPGTRNWGYDGAYPYAVQNSYGGCKGLKELVNEAHAHGISVILDVVYNHLGPEGNYLAEYGPYFTDKYKTPWGRALNFDDIYSAEVRNFFINNALYWLDNYHIDGLRLDAVHGIYDMSAKHFLQELAENVDAFSRKKQKKYYLIAESDLNNAGILRSRSQGGYGIDAQWNDDFHHCLHAIITQEETGYYQDYGQIEKLSRAFKDGFVYQGEYSDFRKRYYGNSSQDIPAHQFIVFSQNHDQIGNRMKGERLAQLVTFDMLKLAAALVILSPYVPMFFMGQEYAEIAPFLYFVEHSDEKLIKAVRRGRKHEFSSFGYAGTPADAQAEETFNLSKLDWEKRYNDQHKLMLDFYKKLIELRRTLASLKKLDKRSIEILIDEKQKLLFWRRWYNRNELFCVMNFSKEDSSFSFMASEGKWNKIIDSSLEIWGSSGTLLPDIIENKQNLNIKMSSFALYQKEVLR